MKNKVNSLEELTALVRQLINKLETSDLNEAGDFEKGFILGQLTVLSDVLSAIKGDK